MREKKLGSERGILIPQRLYRPHYPATQAHGSRDYRTIKEIAAKKKIDPRYVGDVLRLTLLAPDIIEMIFDWRKPRGLPFEQLRKSLPLEMAGTTKCLIPRRALTRLEHQV